jgi:hypothetical protein
LGAAITYFYSYKNIHFFITENFIFGGAPAYRQVPTLRALVASGKKPYRNFPCASVAQGMVEMIRIL